MRCHFLINDIGANEGLNLTTHNISNKKGNVTHETLAMVTHPGVNGISCFVLAITVQKVVDFPIHTLSTRYSLNIKFLLFSQYHNTYTYIVQNLVTILNIEFLKNIISYKV